MSIRITALYIFVVGLSIYAWKDWFKSLCGLILMMAVIRHEDMPTNMFGIQGFNMWNVLFLVVSLAWLASRRREGLTWDMPRYITVLLLLYLGVIVIGFVRAVFDRSYIEDYPLKSLISEELINTIKWALPALLLFDGSRTRWRTIMALICILGMYCLVSVQVVRFMPPGAAFGSVDALSRVRIRLGRYIGYSACDISTMLAGASWGILALLPLVQKKKYTILLLAASSIVVYGQALTGGRAGYLAWTGVGLAMCLLRWRKYLILAPVAAMLLPILFPAAAGRMLSGFGQTNAAGEKTVDDYTVTSGRMQAWPYVVDKICESPVVGYGRLAMQRTGLYSQLLLMDLGFPHPHNVYLESMLDNGILGTIPIALFWGISLIHAARLFGSSNGLCSAVGGVAFALILAQLFGGIGAQHYYPRVSTLGMWAATLLMLRVHVEKQRAQTAAATHELYLNGIPAQQVLNMPACAYGTTGP